MLKYVGSKEYLRGVKKRCKIINHDPFLVGRSQTADLVLTSLNVSRLHCRFTKPDYRDAWLIECLSCVGLIVDGQSLAQGEKKLLTDEALITLGENVYILFYPGVRNFCTHNRSVEILEVIDIAPDSPETTLTTAYCSSSPAADLKSDDKKESSELRLEAESELPSNHQNLSEPETVELKQPGLAGETMKAQDDSTGALQSNVSAEEKVKHLLLRLCETKKQAAEGETQIRELAKELAVRDVELDKVRAEAENQERILQKQLATLATKIVNAEQENLILKEEISRAGAKIVVVENGEKKIRELTEELAMRDEELFKIRAKISEAAIEQSKADDKEKDLQKQLAAVTAKIADAERKNVSLQEENLKANAKIVEANATQKKTEAELNEVKMRNGCLQLQVSAHQAVVGIKEDETKVLNAELAVAKLEIADFKTTYKNLELRVANAMAKSSKLSADVALYKRHWEESELKAISSSLANDKLTKDIAALQLQIKAKRVMPDTTKELIAAKEEAKAEQITSFEEFIETDLQCAICFELVIASTVLNCGHTFCSKCVREWQARSSDCPTCRVPINSMQKCKMLDSFIARAANRLSETFCERRREATSSRGTDSQGQPQRKKPRVKGIRGRQLNFNLPGPEPVPEAEFFVDLT